MVHKCGQSTEGTLQNTFLILGNLTNNFNKPDTPDFNNGRARWIGTFSFDRESSSKYEHIFDTNYETGRQAQ